MIYSLKRHDEQYVIHLLITVFIYEICKICVTQSHFDTRYPLWIYEIEADWVAYQMGMTTRFSVNMPVTQLWNAEAENARRK